jgi:hypothetical protein
LNHELIPGHVVKHLPTQFSSWDKPTLKGMLTRSIVVKAGLKVSEQFLLREVNPDQTTPAFFTPHLSTLACIDGDLKMTGRALGKPIQ